VNISFQAQLELLLDIPRVQELEFLKHLQQQVQMLLDDKMSKSHKCALQDIKSELDFFF
jgi:hypothetical protein